jgi:glycosyltransferase involved in cell wall biosynthesis
MSELIANSIPATQSESSDDSPRPRVSVVIPLYNEQESIPDLYRAVTDALDTYGASYEIIVVDDGSTDNSFSLLSAYAKKDSRFKVVRLRRNFGQTAAFAAGFDLAIGEIIITKDRHDRFLDRKLPSMIANRLISNVTDVRLHDYGCSLKAYRADMLQHVHLYGELHRFIPALASQVGGTVTEVPVNHRARAFGTSKYGISRTVRVMLDLILVWFLGSFATRPIHVFGTMGLISGIVGIFVGLYLTFVKLILQQDIGSRPLLLLAILLVMIGVQLITMGLLGEMITRTYYESQGKSIYIVREIVE